MGEDQHAAGLRGLDEAERGDRLAGAGRVLEPEALGRVGVLGLLGERLLVVLVFDPVAGLLVGVGLQLGLLRSSSASGSSLVLELVVVHRRRPRRARRAARGRARRRRPRRPPHRARPPARRRPRRRAAGAASPWPGTPRRHPPRTRARRGRRSRPRRAARARPRRGRCRRSPPGAAQRLGEQRGERAREGVDLVRGEHGAVDELRLVLGEHAFEAEQQRELPPPGGRGVLGLRVELGEGLVERAPARRAGRERDRGILAVVEEALAHELTRASDVGGGGNGRGREGH